MGKVEERGRTKRIFLKADWITENANKTLKKFRKLQIQIIENFQLKVVLAIMASGEVRHFVSIGSVGWY